MRGTGKDTSPDQVLAKMIVFDKEATYVKLVSDRRCLVCRKNVIHSDEKFCATRKTDGGLVCPACTEKVRRGNTDTLRTLSNSSLIW